MKKTLLFILILTALLLAGCASPGPTEAEGESHTLISSEALVSMMEARRDTFLLINTHIPFEGNLPTTDFSVPYNEINQHLDLFPADKDAEIVLYCMSNRMALIAADDLVAAGYTNLKLLDGGMLAWQSAGQTLDMEP
ncbi:MAG: rhodanese-like domain-containing protein [Brevefilum sp.]|nr:rhodanese-like domain-containing protein [Brevefilum sp.]